MKIIAQPENYSDMLERIFAMTMVSGVLCTIILANGSDTFRSLMESIKSEADIGPIKNIKALYILLPMFVALLSRIIRLHDKISDVLRIRFHFDTRHILFPMYKMVGNELTPKKRESIIKERVSAMYKIFYPYAGFSNPQIDNQLVRTALDNWGWFWVAVESGFLFLITSVILLLQLKWNHIIVSLIFILVNCTLLYIQWRACCHSAQRQIKAILDDDTRKTTIIRYFDSI